MGHGYPDSAKNDGLCLRLHRTLKTPQLGVFLFYNNIDIVYLLHKCDITKKKPEDLYIFKLAI